MSRLTPVLVRTYGRTGSTLLMQILATSQRVLFERLYPFEHRYLTYCHRMAKVVSKDHKGDSEWNNDLLFQGRGEQIGCLPYGRMDLLNREELWKTVFDSLWDQFSDNMRKVSGFDGNEQLFYAEKSPHDIADIVSNRLGGRQIYLLRDPRDEMVSIMSFNQKRGFNSFGWTETDSDVTYARKICRNRRSFMQTMIESDTEQGKIFVRYEDLIMKKQIEVDRLSEWLGVSLSFNKATKNDDIKSRHMTSRDPRSSVERWRKELSVEVKDIFKEELGDELTRLGYQI